MSVVTRKPVSGKRTSDSQRAVSRGLVQRVPATGRRNTPALRRWHDSAPPVAPSRSTSRARAPRPDQEWRELIDHFDRDQVMPAVKKVSKKSEAAAQPKRQTKKRARSKHRPFHLTWPTVVFAAVPGILLVYLLFVNSAALALSHENMRLQSKVEETRFELQRIRKEIATVNASAQVEEWAKERNWRQATQQDFDDVSSVIDTSEKLPIQGQDAL